MKAILICPNSELWSTFENIATSDPAPRFPKSLDHRPDADAFRLLVRVWSPDAFFMNMEDTRAARKGVIEERKPQSGLE